ncbi:MAG: ABC-F family ATP-binding cassette domain-containing protein [Candidatus Nanopelagicales bacterium]|jgi:ATP-binding cassette subfamily F protein uup|nr:ABC-F family ATP-binding cassette domain-containing protein [Candidatus Nanopelagicales bacterium]
MPPVVALEDIHVVFATRAVLAGVTVGLDRGQRVGVVGRNGDGKSTLFRVLAGVVEPDSGRVIRTAGAQVVMVGQSDSLPAGARTVRDVTVGDRPEHEWAADPRIRAVLSGLLGGVAAQGYAQGLDTGLEGLSGGERRRLALARALIDPGDVLLLDEPTNHLDIEAVTWLAGFLTGPTAPPTMAVVTHDRWFLDEIATTTWEVADGTVYRFEGGYAAWVLARAERERREAVAESRRRNLVSKELAWLRRGPPARTSKPQFRIDAANALIADVPELRDKLALRRVASARLGRQVVDLEAVALRVPGAGAGGPGVAAAERTLITDLTWQLGPGDRVGLLGPNGAGKTTLVRLLTGQREPDAGSVVIGSTVVPATLPQTIVAGNPDDRVLPSVERLRREIEIGGRTLTAGTLLEDFGFKGEKATTRVGDLSGGELRRLELLKLLIGGPNLLVLDEPTNDLDVETLAVIEDVLDSWPGSLVVVSHDRYFLERTCDDLYALLGDGRLRHLPRGVEEYLELRSSATGVLQSTGSAAATARVGAGGAAQAAGGTTSGAVAATATGSGGTSGPGSGSAVPRAAGVAAGGLTGAAAHAARKDLSRVETRMARIEALRAGLHAQMADAHTDHERLLVLASEDAALAAEHAELEDRWLELGEALEG